MWPDRQIYERQPSSEQPKEGFVMTDEELIKEFWISHRAEELANEIADPELNPVAHWAAFEEATLSADLEWFANYEGLPTAELDGPLINEARDRLKNWRNDETKSSLTRAGAEDKASTAQGKTGRKTDREVLSSVPRVPAGDPLFKHGFVIGATVLRNSSAKPVKGSE